MSVYIPKNILVTGGAGFIGCNYTRYILSAHKDITIINVDKLTYAGSLKNLGEAVNDSRHIFIQGDICDRELINNLFKKYNIDTVIHFAAESHVDRSIMDPEPFIQTNIMGTYTLLETARRHWLIEKKLTPNQCRFHHVSTDEVYGALSKADLPFTEQSAYKPNSPYSASKASSDHLVRSYFHTYKLPTVTTNCSNNYGPYQHPEKFIPTIINACLKQTAIPIYNDGSNIRDWLYVEDHCEALDLVCRQGTLGETYNIGGDNEWTNLDVVKCIVTIMDAYFPARAPHARLIQFVQDRPGHDWRYAINSEFLQNTLRWKPKYNFYQGIQKYMKWFLEQNNMMKPVTVGSL